MKSKSIWLANTGTQPIYIEQNEVVAMAECVLAGPGASPGNDRNDRDEVNGLMEEKATLDGQTSFSTRSTRATNPQLSNELDATQRHAGRRKGNWLKTCWPSGSSKRATVRGAVRPSW